MRPSFPFRIGQLFLTFFLILFEGFGGDRIRNLCKAHTPCPPIAFQSSRELLFGGAYPVAGGLSGNWVRNSSKANLKGFSSVTLFTDLGNINRFDCFKLFLSEFVNDDIFDLICCVVESNSSCGMQLESGSRSLDIIL